MDVTLLGIVTDVKLLQFANTEAPIDVTLLPMMHSFIWEPKRVSIEHPDTSQLLSKITEVNPLQPEKAAFPIDVTLFGMVTDVSPLQLLKAYWPIDVTLFGITILVRLVQDWNIYLANVVNPGVKVTWVKFEHSSKTFWPQDVTVLGILIDVKPLQR